MMSNEPQSPFRKDVKRIVAQIPEGMVSTYGDIAAMAGHAHAVRIVGGIAHYGDSELPWQRVVNRDGGLASGYPGGRDGHRQVLEHEGITSTHEIVDNFETIRWKPSL